MQYTDANTTDGPLSDAEVLPSLTKYILKSYLSISRIGTMKFSSGFVEDNAAKLGFPSHVILSYSKNGGAVIFDFVNDDKQTGSKKLKSLKGAAFWTVSVLKMFKSINIDIAESRGRYEPVMERMCDGALKWVIYLNENEADNENHGW